MLCLSNCLIRCVCKKSLLPFSYFSMVIKKKYAKSKQICRKFAKPLSLASPPPPLLPLYMCCNIHNKTTSYARKTTSYAHKTTSYAHKTTSYAHKTTSYARKTTSYAHKTTSYAHKTTSYVHKTTSYAFKTYKFNS